MKNIFKTVIILGLVASATSCKKYLDINENPNKVTSATPELILPQALTATAALSQTFNGSTYGMDLGGYIANAGGVGGYGNFWTFVFNQGDANALWNNTFDNLQDYQYILNNTTTTGDYKNFNAVARLMKAFDYLRLVDAYGDVPYSQALKGAANLTPAYDKGQDVYKACIAEINAAITQMKAPSAASTITLTSTTAGKVDVTVYSTGTSTNPLSFSSDALQNGKDMTGWIKFANTIKLRALLRIQKVADLSSVYTAEKAAMAGFSTADFVDADVLINPGYVQQDGKQNPLWNALAWTYTGTNATGSFLPSTFVTAFYNGTKLTDGKKAGNGVTPTDNGRGNLIYRDYAHSNQLGFQSTSLVSAPTGGEWYVGTSGNGAPSGIGAVGFGVMKGFNQGQTIMTAAESYLLQAEAALIGFTGGNAATLFDAGIRASFVYLDKDAFGIVASKFDPTAQVATYKADNPASYLVNYSLATNDAQRLEAIITQKYIALNTLNSEEGWNDYRRTQYPKSDPAGNASMTFAPNFATNQSPRADKLAGRIVYPTSEANLNTANVPKVDPSSSLIFWDARPKN